MRKLSLLNRFLVLGVVFLPGIAVAGEVIGPIYSPLTQSYFELRDDNLPPDAYWWTADKRARAARFKGVQGRLAVIRSPEVHQFLEENGLIRDYTWIGLRYFCYSRKLLWSSGDRHRNSDFNNWARPWYNSSVTTCGNEGTSSEINGSMGVFYIGTSAGFRWRAAGYEKFFVNYLIEYPTGAP